MLNEGINQMAAKPSAQSAYMEKYNAGHQDMIWMHPGDDLITIQRAGLFGDAVAAGRLLGLPAARFADYETGT